MPKYRKKPIVIEAIQWTGTNLVQIMEAFNTMAFGQGYLYADGQLIIDTLEGNMLANPGDYIIKGIKGEFYPCKPDIFEATYEAIGEDG